MLSNLTKQSATRPIAFASMILASMITVSAPSFADPYVQHTVDPTNYEFRASHPFKVFVTVGGIGKRGNDTASHIVRSHVANLVPSYVVLVSDRRRADMVLRADELDYRLSFHVTDVDQRRKKYKNRRKYTGGQCGIHQHAYYTRITEKGVALSNFKLTTRLRGVGSYANTFSIEADEKYRHGKNLRAQTNCGFVQTTYYPNAAVERLFSQPLEQQRQNAAFEIRKETTQKLAHVIARNIGGRSEQFYADLATQYSYSPAYVEPHEYARRQHRSVYDHDDDARYNDR